MDFGIINHANAYAIQHVVAQLPEFGLIGHLAVVNVLQTDC